MATRPQTDPNIIELDAYRNDREKSFVDQVRYEQVTEPKASEHDIAHVIRTSFGVEPIAPAETPEEIAAPKATAEQPVATVAEVPSAPAQVYEKALNTQAEAVAPVDPQANLSIDEKRAGVDLAYAEAGEPEIILPEAA